MYQLRQLTWSNRWLLLPPVVPVVLVVVLWIGGAIGGIPLGVHDSGGIYVLFAVLGVVYTALAVLVAATFLSLFAAASNSALRTLDNVLSIGAALTAIVVYAGLLLSDL